MRRWVIPDVSKGAVGPACTLHGYDPLQSRDIGALPVTKSKSESILVYSKYQHDLSRFKEALSEALPELEINYADTPEDAERYFSNATILYGWGFPTAWLRHIPNLQWVQKMGAGVDDLVPAWPSDLEIKLKRTDGRLIAARMAKYVLAMILDHNLRLDRARDLQRAAAWQFFEMGALSQLTVGIAGFGDIGSEVAKMLRTHHCNVVGWRRSKAECEFVNKIYVGMEQLGDFVYSCDVVVLVLPLTADTNRVSNKKVFGQFKQTAYLVNVGRGGVVDEDALLITLNHGTLARASLDIFGQEPLPEAHPFWKHPKVTLTPQATHSRRCRPALRRKRQGIQGKSSAEQSG
jgi:glyoxylate/hydroxypyruvate reductase